MIRDLVICAHTRTRVLKLISRSFRHLRRGPPINLYIYTHTHTHTTIRQMYYNTTDKEKKTMATPISRGTQ